MHVTNWTVQLYVIVLETTFSPPHSFRMDTTASTISFTTKEALSTKGMYMQSVQLCMFGNSAALMRKNLMMMYNAVLPALRLCH